MVAAGAAATSACESGGAATVVDRSADELGGALGVALGVGVADVDVGVAATLVVTGPVAVGDGTACAGAAATRTPTSARTTAAATAARRLGWTGILTRRIHSLGRCPWQFVSECESVPDAPRPRTASSGTGTKSDRGRSRLRPANHDETNGLTFPGRQSDSLPGGAVHGCGSAPDSHRLSLQRKQHVCPRLSMGTSRTLAFAARASQRATGGSDHSGARASDLLKSSGYGQCRQPRAQQEPRSARNRDVNTNSPVSGSR